MKNVKRLTVGYAHINMRYMNICGRLRLWFCQQLFLFFCCSSSFSSHSICNSIFRRIIKEEKKLKSSIDRWLSVFFLCVNANMYIMHSKHSLEFCVWCVFFSVCCNAFFHEQKYPFGDFTHFKSTRLNSTHMFIWIQQRQQHLGKKHFFWKKRLEKKGIEYTKIKWDDVEKKKWESEWM